MHVSARKAIGALTSTIILSTTTKVQAVAFHHVFTGTGALEVQLIAAKLALKYGDSCSILGSTNPTQVKKCIALMYGREAGNEYDPAAGSYTYSPPATEAGDGVLEFASDNDAIGKALAKADDVVVFCEEKGVDDSFVETLLDNAPKVKHLALLSKHGGKLRSTEDSMRRKCLERSDEKDGDGVAFSVLRAGNLVGGGPGYYESKEVERTDEDEFGLSKFFYDTKFDLSDAMITMAMDKFTLGVRVSPGDPFRAPNFFSKILAGNSFEPRDGDTGRIAAACGLIAAVRRRGEGAGVDVSLSTARAEEPSSLDDWDALLECS